MAKENENMEVEQQQAATSQTPERDAWMSGMKGKYPELGDDEEALFKASREGYDSEHELNKKNAADNGRLYSAIQKSPEIADFVSRLGSQDEDAEPEEALAAFGEDLTDLLTGKIDNAKYRERKAANAQAKADKDAADKAAGEAYVQACEELGLDPEESMSKLQAKYGEGLVGKDLYVAMLKSLSYDEDMQAAELRGRNAQIGEKNKRRSSATDGLPHTQSVSRGGAPKKSGSLGAIMQREKELAM